MAGSTRTSGSGELSTPDVRRWYTWGRSEEAFDEGVMQAPVTAWWAEFDAWLNATRAQAWDQGRLAAKWDTPNPYRTAEQVRETMGGEGK